MAFKQPLARSPPATLLHLVALGTLSWAFHELFLPGPMTDFMATKTGGRWEYLTILRCASTLASPSPSPTGLTEPPPSLSLARSHSLAASWLTFACALAFDLVPLQLLSRAKTTLAVLVVPIEGLVSVLYWSLMLVDPALLNPATAPGEEPFRIPLKLDIALHALPALFLWTDFLAFSPPFPQQARPAVIATTATAAYCAWMEYCAQGNGGTYPYPMLSALPPPPPSLRSLPSG